MLTEVKNRGVADVCIAVCDGLKGLPDAINTVWALATVQQCIIHLIRNVRHEAPVLPIGGKRPAALGRRSANLGRERIVGAAHAHPDHGGT